MDKNIINISDLKKKEKIIFAKKLEISKNFKDDLKSKSNHKIIRWNQNLYKEYIKIFLGEDFQLKDEVVRGWNYSIEIECIKCGHKFSLTLSDISLRPLRCPNCNPLFRKRNRDYKLPWVIVEERLVEIPRLNDFSFNIDSYKGFTKEIEITCNRCNYKFYDTPKNMIYGNSCPQCGKELHDLRTKENSRPNIMPLSKAKSIFNNSVLAAKWEIDWNNYRGVGSIDLRCKNCGKILHGSLDYLIKISDCPNCGKSRSDKISEAVMLSKDEAFARINNLNILDKFDIDWGTYEGWCKPINITCKTCGLLFRRSLAELKLGCTCPNRCYSVKSKGEQLISEIFLKNNIRYIPHYHFRDCKYKNSLEFDFYLPEKNICIEYQGIQHYRPVKIFGGLDAFEEIKIKDSIKAKYCEDKGIILIPISYILSSDEIEKEFIRNGILEKLEIV